MNTDRIKKKVKVTDIIGDLEGTLDDAIEYLIKFKEQYKDRDRAWLSEDFDYDSRQLYFCYEREEDDKEYERRMSDKKRQEENERATYNQLKAKFEKDETK